MAINAAEKAEGRVAEQVQDIGQAPANQRYDCAAPEYIVLARPLSELWEHALHRELPSWGLLARAIYVLVLAIFRLHVCDYTLFLNGELLYQSLTLQERMALGLEGRIDYFGQGEPH